MLLWSDILKAREIYRQKRLAEQAAQRIKVSKQGAKGVKITNIKKIKEKE